MDKELYETYVRILNKELVTAMGCTEPIAIAKPNRQGMILFQGL